MSNNVQVSIICTAYNHEKYIRQCLDGFVMQKDVTFEIIIHDDASTDKTAEIIREYEKKYPDIFKPIYQTENQYSKHIDLIKEHMIPLVTGKYVALCESDDYWTDPYKLKKQFDALESNPDCVMSAHKVNVIKEDGAEIGYTCPREDIQTSVLPLGYICTNYPNAKYIHTSSFFLKADNYKDFRLNPPRFRKVAPVGDIPTLLYFTSLGKAYYLNETMSHYRFMSLGSWSFRNQNDAEKEKRHREINIKMKNMFVEYCAFAKENNLSFSLGKIEQEIADLRLSEYWYCRENNDYASIFNEFTVKELKEFGLNTKALIRMKLHMMFPKMFKSK